MVERMDLAVKILTDVVYLVVFLYVSYKDVYYTFVDDWALFLGGIVPIIYIGYLSGNPVATILFSVSVGVLSFFPGRVSKGTKTILYSVYVLSSIGGFLLIGRYMWVLTIIPLIIISMVEKNVMGIADLVLLSSFVESVSLLASIQSISSMEKILSVIYSLIGLVVMTGVMIFVTGLVALSYSCDRSGKVFFSDKLRIRGSDLLRAPWFIDIPGVDPNIDMKDYKKKRKELAKKNRSRCIEVRKKIPLVPPLSFMLMVLLFSI